MSPVPSPIRWCAKHVESIAVPLVALAALGAILWIGSPYVGADKAAVEMGTCSMHPQIRLPLDQPCPLCGMALTPLSQMASDRERDAARTGLATEPVAYRELRKEIRTVGKLDYNERRIAYITARIAGRVDRVFADYTGITVKEGDHLVDLYSPALYGAQAELLQALSVATGPTSERRFSQENLEAARDKLRLLGILPGQIAEIEATRKATTHLTLHAPIGGVVVEKNVREQQYVAEGDMLYRIAELDPIWLLLDVYESDLGWIRYGQQVDVRVEAYPGESFRGTVVFIDPFLNDQTRTVKVRVNLKNPDRRLKPAMYASATIRVRLTSDGGPEPTGLEGKFLCPMHPDTVSDVAGKCAICAMDLEPIPHVSPNRDDTAARPAEAAPAGQVLGIAKSAVLDTGRRTVAYRQRTDGVYELVELKLGPLAEGVDGEGKPAMYYPVLSGLGAGEKVVTRGGFLLDSQRQIEGMPSLLYPDGLSVAALHAGHEGHVH